MDWMYGSKDKDKSFFCSKEDDRAADFNREAWDDVQPFIDEGHGKGNSRKEIETELHGLGRACYLTATPATVPPFLLHNHGTTPCMHHIDSLSYDLGRSQEQIPQALTRENIPTLDKPAGGDGRDNEKTHATTIPDLHQPQSYIMTLPFSNQTHNLTPKRQGISGWTGHSSTPMCLPLPSYEETWLDYLDGENKDKPSTDPVNPMMDDATVMQWSSFDDYLSTGGHLDNIQAMYWGPSPGTPPSSYPLFDPKAIKHGVDFILNLFSNFAMDNANGQKPQLMAELMDMLNTPAPHTEGLTPLHWLSLNPLVILGAPTGHLGPLPPPAPLSQDPDLHQTIVDAVGGVVDNCFCGHLEPFHNMSGDVQVGFEDINCRLDEMDKKFNFLVHASLSPPVLDVVKPALVTPAKAKPTSAPTPAPASRPTPLSPSKPTFTSMAKSPLFVAACRRSCMEHLNAVLDSEGHPVTLSATQWTAKNNLVVTTRPDTMAHHLTSASHLIADCLVHYLSTDQSPLPVQARENCKWACLLINGIPTRVLLTWGPYTSSELHVALLADNPAY
ncbi:hypothetical protein EDB89DRAFT_1903247 [Lactarius sanguifluus]|nr:hypothetical protein EDB89DRAFT_1903247 [Lactarius sanguifluus]